MAAQAKVSELEHGLAEALSKLEDMDDQVLKNFTVLVQRKFDARNNGLRRRHLDRLAKLVDELISAVLAAAASSTATPKRKRGADQGSGPRPPRKPRANPGKAPMPKRSSRKRPRGAAGESGGEESEESEADVAWSEGSQMESMDEESFDFD